MLSLFLIGADSGSGRRDWAEGGATCHGFSGSEACSKEVDGIVQGDEDSRSESSACS